jgi:hypothetical protein
VADFNINNIKISWDIEDIGDGQCSVKEAVEGIERCFIYGPVPKSEVDDFIEERKVVMSEMVKRFRKKHRPRVSRRFPAGSLYAPQPSLAKQFEQ